MTSIGSWRLVKIEIKAQNIDLSKFYMNLKKKKLVTCVSFPLPNKTKLEYDMVNVLLFGWLIGLKH